MENRVRQANSQWMVPLDISNVVLYLFVYNSRVPFDCVTVLEFSYDFSLFVSSECSNKSIYSLISFRSANPILVPVVCARLADPIKEYFQITMMNL